MPKKKATKKPKKTSQKRQAPQGRATGEAPRGPLAEVDYEAEKGRDRDYGLDGWNDED